MNYAGSKSGCPGGRNAHVVWGDARGRCGADISPHNVGLEELAEPVCLYSPSPCKDTLDLLVFVGNTAPSPASEQRSAIALGGEDPENQRGDDAGFPLVLFPCSWLS